ncbi:FAD-binding domain-containing protein [Metabacillus sp. HB246100]
MINVVWFKRDLRIHDHRPLVEASKYGEVLPIYIVEPSIWKGKDVSIRHFQFVLESLEELSENLSQIGGKLFVAIAEMEEVLEAIFDKLGPFRLFAHEENGTPLTYERDRRVRQWMNERDLLFREFQEYGVMGGLQTRNSFQKQWNSFMNESVVETPKRILSVDKVPPILIEEIHKLSGFHVKGETIRFGQQGGESNAVETLTTFLEERYKSYTLHISKPLQSTASCSRLSPYLAFGNISIRYVVQRTRDEINRCENAFYLQQLEAFMSRLQWHCHFIQRIENEPEIQMKAINEAFDTIRTDWDEEAFMRWYNGKTGIPLVDASMRCLHKTGWINFLSRAMLVSFVCHTLMLDWRRPSFALAQLFLDYEPGIHYSHMQLQAGTTGFHTIRIYNPIKMGKEHDPEGTFIRRYVPELSNVPAKYIHEPWLYPGFHKLDYEAPIVDVIKANKRAREILYSVKQSKESKEQSQDQLKKHGSRLRPGKTKEKSDFEQLSFDL